MADASSNAAPRGSAECDRIAAPAVYETPEVTWEEDFAVVVVGISCIKFPGVQECVDVGPIFQ